MDAVPGTDFLKLFATYFLASGVLLLFGYVLFRQWNKAAIFSFTLLSIHLFFGAFHDALKSISPHFLLARYIVLLPLIAVFILFVILFLKKETRSFTRFTSYLNLLFLVLVLLDMPVLFRQTQAMPAYASLPVCDSCEKPDVYLIIADGYADSASLSLSFNFNNGPFLSQLRQRGFFIADSKSNYNFTPFSMASLFTMSYLDGLEGKNSSYADRLKCARAINRNSTWDFFTKSGYEIINNSIYKINNEASVALLEYFKVGTDFIASHTLLARIKRDLGYHLATTLKLRSVLDDYTYAMDRKNKILLQRLQADIRKKSEKSRFIYTHLHIPHYPYYYMKDGSPNPIIHQAGYEFDKNAYIDYLQYGNRIYLNLVDEILQHSSRPPLIIFMSDHGFREYDNPTAEEKEFHFMNLNAVYLPSGDYSGFYRGITSVNQLRTILNTFFKQNLPMLKDSTSFLAE